MTRQEFTDAVAQLLGLHPGVEMQVDTITRLADAYAWDAAMDAARAAAEFFGFPPVNLESLLAGRRADGDHLLLSRLRRGPDR